MGEIRNGFEEGKNLPAFDTRDMTELQLLSTSKGNQRKWYFPKKDIYVKEQFFYQGKYGFLFVVRYPVNIRIFPKPDLRQPCLKLPFIQQAYGLYCL